MVKASKPLDSFKNYYSLAKPGIVYGNLLSTTAGFFLAERGHFNLIMFLGLMFGTALIIGSACVFNNYLDRNIDKKMDRTKNRPLANSHIPVTSALIYATFLGIIGFLSLIFYTNLLTVVIGVVGIVFYVVVYGLAKRKSVHGTLIGTISGSMPIVAGYTSVTGQLDLEGLMLFLLLAFWQMPHFYAIAIYRFNDYKRAGIPVLPVKKGVFITKLEILFYTAAFVITALLLTVLKFTGLIYFLVLAVIGGYWIGLGIKGLSVQNDQVWAHKMFGLSLVSLLVLCLMLSINAILF